MIHNKNEIKEIDLLNFRITRYVLKIKIIIFIINVQNKRNIFILQILSWKINIRSIVLFLVNK